MSKQILTKSVLTLFAMLLCSTAPKTFAQAAHPTTTQHVLAAGDPGNDPDPTGGGTGLVKSIGTN